MCALYHDLRGPVAWVGGVMGERREMDTGVRRRGYHAACVVGAAVGIMRHRSSCPPWAEGHTATKWKPIRA